MPMVAKLLKKVGPEPSKAGVGSASKRGAPMKRPSTLARKTPLMEAQLPEAWEDDDYGKYASAVLFPAMAMTHSFPNFFKCLKDSILASLRIAFI